MVTAVDRKRLDGVGDGGDPGARAGRWQRNPTHRKVRDEWGTRRDEWGNRDTPQPRGFNSPISLLADRIRAGARPVAIAVCGAVPGTGPGTLDTLILSGAAQNLPFIRGWFRDVC
jgi:hypothetical protein